MAPVAYPTRPSQLLPRRPSVQSDPPPPTFPALATSRPHLSHPVNPPTTPPIPTLLVSPHYRYSLVYLASLASCRRGARFVELFRLSLYLPPSLCVCVCMSAQQKGSLPVHLPSGLFKGITGRGRGVMRDN
ncbi:unnamed protein product [Protopolystoma xenopodis]|uniref:Uncharacterized protein n=1 Tax=Protopolystoma xenopodis TaxID=117903 RepID=A0A3S5BDU8_9PLAT|nr:unnamed protein product [Protopolystoma xenopodis]